MSTEDLLFNYWLNRKSYLLSESKGLWQGNCHPTPIILHKLIDNELDRLRPLTTDNLK